MLSRVDIRPTEIDFSNINPLTHRNLAKRRNKLLILLTSAPPSLKPILTFPKGRNK